MNLLAASRPTTRPVVRLLAALVLLAGLLGLPARAARAATLTVPGDYATIQAAIDAATAGDTIQVSAGTYAGDFTVDKSVTISGAGKADTSLWPAYQILVTAAQVTFENLSVEGGTQGLFFQSAAFGVVSNVGLDGQGGSSIVINNSSNAILENVTSTGADEIGILINGAASSGASLSYVEISGSALGLFSSGGAGNITGDHLNIHDNTSAGIRFDINTGSAITNSTITYNPVGVFYDSVMAGSLVGSIIRSNGTGIRFDGSSSSAGNFIQEDRIYGNTAYGLYFANYGRNNTIRYNDIFDNGVAVRIDAVPSQPNTGNEFYNNAFMNNTAQVQLPASGAANSWDAGYSGWGNYWDDLAGADLYSGPAQDVPGPDDLIDTPLVLVAGENVDHYPLLGLRLTNDGPTPLGYGTSFQAYSKLLRYYNLQWDFGDGQTDTSTTFYDTHYYAGLGVHTACVTATDSGGSYIFNDNISLSDCTSVTVRADHTDNYLRDLVLSQGTLDPAFAFDTNAYTARVGLDVDSLTVTPTLDDLAASVQVNGAYVSSGAASDPIDLLPGRNVITVFVRAEDFTLTRTYTVTVYRGYVLYLPLIIRY